MSCKSMASPFRKRTWSSARARRIMAKGRVGWCDDTRYFHQFCYEPCSTWKCCCNSDDTDRASSINA